MFSRKTLFAACALLLAVPAAAGVIGKLERYPGLTAADAQRAPAERRAAWQDYFARSDAAREVDLAVLAAERKGLTNVPPPVHDSFHDHSMPLNKPVEWYGSVEARHIADAIASFQTPAGGWGKNQDFTKPLRLKGQMWVPFEEAAITHAEDFGNPKAKWHFVGTIDNDATTTQMHFLAKTIAQAGSNDTDVWKKSFLKGLNYLFAAEFPGGGWPQVWPLEGGYHDALTYNDNAFANTVELLDDVADNEGGLYGFVPAEVKAKAAAAVQRARKMLVASQVVVNGKRTVWGQQIDPITLKSVAARNFEPAELSATESADLLLFLMRLPDPHADEIAAVHAGATWLKAAAIANIAWEKTEDGRKLVSKDGAGPMWARFYIAETMKPVVGDRDMTIHDDVNEISPERRAGYSWYNTGPAKTLKTYEKWAKAHPAK